MNLFLLRAPRCNAVIGKGLCDFCRHPGALHVVILGKLMLCVSEASLKKENKKAKKQHKKSIDKPFIDVIFIFYLHFFSLPPNLLFSASFIHPKHGDDSAVYIVPVDSSVVAAVYAVFSVIAQHEVFVFT